MDPTIITTQMPEFKVILIGRGGCGKTSYIKQLLLSQFSEMCVPTFGVEVYSIQLETTVGPIKFAVWDCAGQDKYRCLGDGYYIGADCCIHMIDGRENLPDNVKIPREFGYVTDIPICTVFNKVDQKKIQTNIRTRVRGCSGCVFMSVKQQTNLLTPFLILARQLMNNPELEFC